MRENLRRRLYVVAAVLLALGIYFAVTVIHANRQSQISIRWGVTFSTKYAKELGIDWKKAYIATLDELGVKYIRIPVYWDEVQPQNGQYDFSDVDWMLAEAEKRDAKVLLAIGRRVPRWPECHTPEWASKGGIKEENRRVLELVKAETEHFKNAPALEEWQMENEPLLDMFGKCPSGDAKFLGEERQTLKQIDTAHPVVITDSGELSVWLPTAFRADILGISMYRVTWSKWFGYFYYPITPRFYRDKAQLLYPIVKKVIVTELQAEPWPAGGRSIPETAPAELSKSMNLEIFKNNLEFARRVGFSDVILWGVEWWYWSKDRGGSAFWDQAKAVFSSGR
jgi:hypothetical protein